MFQIDVDTAAASLPASTAPGAPGYFSDGNPALQVPATILPAEFMNMLMLELANLVTAGGLGLDKANFTQVRDAIFNLSLREAEGRVTLTTGVSVTTADVTAAATVYYTPHNGNCAPVYDGTRFRRRLFAEISLALDSASGHTGYHQSGKNFDVFLFDNAGTLAIGTGPAWTSDTARGTGAGTTELQRVTGIWTNKNSITLRFGSASGNTVVVPANQATYLGTFRTTADGQTEDSLAKRFVWNASNRRPRAMKRMESTASWTYTLSAFRQANANTANQLDMIRGLDEDAVHVDVLGQFTNSGATGSVSAQLGVGLDSTTTNSATGAPQIGNVSGMSVPIMARYDGFPGLGRHFLAWLEESTPLGTTTWTSITSQSGMSGTVQA